MHGKEKRVLSKLVDLGNRNLDVDFKSYDGDAKGDLPESYETKDFSKVRNLIKGPINESSKIKKGVKKCLEKQDHVTSD